MNKKIISAFLAIAMVSSIFASDLDFTYNAFGDNPETFGFNKVETYDVGVFISGKDFTGKRVKGFKVEIDVLSDNLENISGWLSKSLQAEKKGSISVNHPDLVSVDATVGEDRMLTVAFPKPQEIPEEGLYVGYSFSLKTVAEGNGDEPVSVVSGRLPGSLWLHSSISQQKWADYSKRKDYKSAMIISLEGDFASDAAVAILPEEGLMSMEEETSIEVEIFNHGTTAINSVDYVYNLGGNERNGIFYFDEPIPSVLGRVAKMPLMLPVASETGEIPMEFRILKVNGMDNGSLDKEASTAVLTSKLFVPVTRPLVEEFTGLNCGWCPRGYVMLEQEKQKHGDRFVALSYHSSEWEQGAMCCVNPKDFPVSVRNYPNATLNRGSLVDPSNIPGLWSVAQAQPASCSIDTEIGWEDDSRSTLRITGKARFLSSTDAHNYKLSFAIVADGLNKQSWVQSNYYSTYEAEEAYAGTFWNLFVGQPDHVIGLEFNDIVVYYRDVHGIEGSLPEEIVAGETYEYSFTVPIEEIVNLKGENIVTDFNKVRVVGIVLNGSRPANCASSLYIDGNNSIDWIESKDNTEAEITDVIYHDFQGRQLRCVPERGMALITEIYSDGRRRTYKHIK